MYYLFADPAAPEQAVDRARPRADSGARGRRRAGAAATAPSRRTRSTCGTCWPSGTRRRCIPRSRSSTRGSSRTRSRRPSWSPRGSRTILFGALAALALVGALVRQPILRRSAAGAGAPGLTPIALAIHGDMATPRGPVRLYGTPAQLEWMSVEEVARTRWRYWGAALGDVRGDVEAAVRGQGSEERLVLHGPIGSVIWPVENVAALQIEAGEAFLGYPSSSGAATSRAGRHRHADLRRRPRSGTPHWPNFEAPMVPREDVRIRLRRNRWGVQCQPCE